MDSMQFYQSRLKHSLKANSNPLPYLEPALNTEKMQRHALRVFKRAVTEAWQQSRASLMRRTADVDPELIRNAEIRALTDPS